MSTSTKVFKGTPESAATWQPWIGSGTLSQFGVPLGISLQTRQLVMIDPWGLKISGLIDSTVFEAIGHRGFGKSALLKSLTLRLLALQAGQVDGIPVQMRARIHDRKPEEGEPEYGPVTEYLESEVEMLNKIASLNLFDPSMNMEELDIVEVAVNACEMAKGSPLTNFEPLALQVGIYKMLTTKYVSHEIITPEILEATLRTLTADDINDYYTNSVAQMSRLLSSQLDKRGDADEQAAVQAQLQLVFKVAHNVPAHEFLSDAARTAGYINRILRGDYGKLFGGNGSLRKIMSQPMATFDWTGVPERARTLLEAMMWKWQTTALNNNDLDIIPHLDIGDEEHEAYRNLMHVRFELENSKKARAYHTVKFRSTQYEPDLFMNDEGSEINRLAKGIQRGISGRWIARQPNDPEILEPLSRLGISDLDLHFLTILPVGCFGIKLPERPIIFYRHILNPIEFELCKSDAAAHRMVDRVPVMSVPGMPERAAKTGLLHVGRD